LPWNHSIFDDTTCQSASRVYTAWKHWNSIGSQISKDVPRHFAIREFFRLPYRLVGWYIYTHNIHTCTRVSTPSCFFVELRWSLYPS